MACGLQSMCSVRTRRAAGPDAKQLHGGHSALSRPLVVRGHHELSALPRHAAQDELHTPAHAAQPVRRASRTAGLALANRLSSARFGTAQGWPRVGRLPRAVLVQAPSTAVGHGLPGLAMWCLAMASNAGL